MEKNIDYTISDNTEDIPVGEIKYLFSNEVTQFFSEKELLNELKDYIYSAGINSVNVKVNSTPIVPRHGLKYELLKIKVGEYGLDYTKEDYEKALKKRITNKNFER